MEPLSSPPTKKRRPNFSEDELLMLLAEVSKRKALLLGPLTNSVTLRSKDRAWETVAVAVGGVGRVKREKGEVRKKFKDFRSEVKKKAAKINKERKKTGGGSLDVNDQLKASEEAMWSLLELEAIDGLANIEDSEELSSMASATIENEEPAPPRTTSVAACKPPTPHPLAGTSPKRVAMAELYPVSRDANIFLEPATGPSAIREVTVTSVSQDTNHVPNEHDYHREEPNSSNSTPRRGQSGSRGSTRGHEETASLQRVINVQNNTQEMLDRHLTRIGDNLTRIGDLLEKIVQGLTG
ncbi:myb/SANT-like DNA-binding domain-containing protein 4 [Eriocheir sinensis]|uniref:myb/SANT-like DNA-binding domain-containing protein 4 n=1 Tax=Eriocheir sinensis TaxID=95602 RepID=UPI0021C63641|nr:myb/SANT-like DNA-binding domain-containing protein 4 [Eriocheir sinensis]